ncbi:hypothetical protein QTP86_001109 [Hemibagrus guttatus]|nr:hypothetical protein QTP86_001109 [Hemibagrus guttatus]
MVNQEIGRFLRSYCSREQQRWSEFLPWAEYAQNSLTHASIIPFQCILGYQPPLFSWAGEPSDVPAVEDWYQRSQEVWERAHVRLQRAVRRQRIQADRRRRLHPSYRVGQLVWLSTRNLCLKLPCRKLSPRFVGPFEIIRQVNPVAYRLRLPATYRICPTFHVSLLKPAHTSTERAPAGEEPPPPLDIEGSPAYWGEPALISEKHRAPVADLPILVFNGKCQLSSMVLGTVRGVHGSGGCNLLPAPPGVDVLEGRKLTSDEVLDCLDQSLHSPVVEGGAVPVHVQQQNFLTGPTTSQGTSCPPKHKGGNTLDLVFTHPSPATDMTATPLHISDHHLVSFTITLPVLPKYTMASARISACLVDISSWMMAHQLKLNPSKTELLAIPDSSSSNHQIPTNQAAAADDDVLNYAAGAGGNWATVGRRSRGGRRVRRQREKRKGKSVGLRIGTLNVGTMTGKGRELADMMERRKVDILCVQETRWKGSKARSIGAGFKLFYYGVDSKRNGVGVVLKEEFVRNVLEVKRVSNRVMSLKLEIEGVMLNVVSGYAPQVGCELEEKERFWSELDEVMESIPTGERVVIGADFNGHVGEGNTGDEEVMGKFGVKERNLEGQMVVDFAKRMDMGVVNTYFQKREEHRVTYKSGVRSTRVDYILCRRDNLKEISDCKVVVGESVARQHRMVLCRMTLMVCKKKSKIEKKTKWWKLKKEECCEEFRQKLRQALGGQVVLPDDWETTAEVIRETGKKVLGVSSGRRIEDKETWWWNEEVQDSIQRKRLAKKKWDMDRTEENRQEYKELQRRVKREVSKAKQKAYDELYTRLDTREGEKDLYRLARQRDRDGKDVQQVRVIKDRDGRVLTSEESVQRRWK